MPRTFASTFERNCVCAAVLALSAGPSFGVEGRGPSPVIMLLAVLQFATFAGALWLLFKLWMTVFEFMGNKPTERAKLLAGVLGRSEVGASAGPLRVRAVGAGLGGTVAILGIAVLAMYVLGDHVVTS